MSSIKQVVRLKKSLRAIYNEFTVDLYVTKENIELAKQQITHVNEANALVEELLKQILNSNSLKSTTSIKKGPCKTLCRTFEKMIGKYNGDLGKMPDIGKFRLLVSGADDIRALRNHFFGSNPVYTEREGHIVDKNPTNKITIKKIKDYFFEPSETGRIGLTICINVKLSSNVNVPVEVVALHRNMELTEDFTRDNYLSKQKIIRHANSLKRDLTEDEKTSIEGYDNSSKERYIADSLNYGMNTLQSNTLLRQQHQNSTYRELVNSN